jgi:predicted ribosome quality control (RQC) complex YloA/Tae2 family protein
LDALAALAGARIRRIELLGPSLLALALDAGCALLIGTAREARGVGLVARVPRRRDDHGFVHTLRARLADATLHEARQEGAALLLRFDTPAGATTLACVFDGHAGAFVLCDDAGCVLAAWGPAAPKPGATFTSPPAQRPFPLADSLSALEATGAALIAAAATADVETRRRTLLRAVTRAADRAGRRLAAIDDDLRGAYEADTLRRHASLLLAVAHATARDATELQICDEAETPPRTLVYPLAPQPGGGTGPRATVAAAEALFTRARKRETAARIGAERRADTARACAALSALSARIAAAVDGDALRVLADEAHANGVPGARAAVEAAKAGHDARRHATAERRVPYRRFLSADGRPLLVGRGARDNDTLTLHHARPHDLWLHARGVPGAHVIVPLARGEICPDARLLDAATLAAHFSEARGEGVVDVQHAARRHVRKPRGSAPGAVLVDRERVVVLRLETERLARLLRSETLADASTDADRTRKPHE